MNPNVNNDGDGSKNSSNFLPIPSQIPLSLQSQMEMNVPWITPFYYPIGQAAALFPPNNSATCSWPPFVINNNNSLLSFLSKTNNVNNEPVTDAALTFQNYPFQNECQQLVKPETFHTVGPSTSSAIENTFVKTTKFGGVECESFNNKSRNVNGHRPGELSYGMNTPSLLRDSSTSLITSAKVEDEVSSIYATLKNDMNDSNSNTEPIVVGDYSNPFERSQDKMRDAIDLYRYLWLVDRYGLSKRPIYRPFLLRNLCYMQRKRRKMTTDTIEDYSNCNANKVSSRLIKNALHTPKLSPQKYIAECGDPTDELVATAVKFNFICNNLCFGDRSAIVQCFHVSEVDYELDVIQRIPSATFAMKVNEKLSHISIDLPDSFGTGFTLLNQSRSEHFIVKVVFRYEVAEVRGGKRLRKVPSRERTDDKTSQQTNKTDQNVGKQSTHEEVVMFGTKQIVSFSKENALNVLHGETSIALHSSSELNIVPSNNEWMKNPSFLTHIQRLQRKTLDNPFMSIQVLNAEDEDDEDSSDDDTTHNKDVLENCLEGLVAEHGVAMSKTSGYHQKSVRRKDLLNAQKHKQKKSALVSNVGRKRKHEVCGLGANTAACNKKRGKNRSSSPTTREYTPELNQKVDTAMQKSSVLVPSSLPDDFVNIDDVYSCGETSLPEKIALQFVSSKFAGVQKKTITNSIFFGLATSSSNGNVSIKKDVMGDPNYPNPEGTKNFTHSDNDYCNGAKKSFTTRFESNNCNKRSSKRLLLSTDDDYRSSEETDDSSDNDERIMHDDLGDSLDDVMNDECDSVENHQNGGGVVTRVLNTSYLCFFCLNQLAFKSLNSLIMHFRFCHPRFTFIYEENIVVSKNLTLPGFTVSLYPNFDASCEINPIRHYVKHATGILKPKKIAIAVDPIWIVTRQFSRKVRRNWLLLEKSVKEAENFNSSLFKDALMGGEIRLGAHYNFDPPTKINHQWLTQANYRKLNEITDLHPCERAIMQIWNKFLLDIRITLLGKNMVYKASRVFVEQHRDLINDSQLRIHFLQHLINLNNIGGIDEDERYDLFRRLDADYNPLEDDVHYVSRQLMALNRTRVRSTFRRSGEFGVHCRTSSASNLQFLARRGGTPESGGGSAPPDSHIKNSLVTAATFESFDNLRAAFPTANLRRMEKLWQFLEVYTPESFKMV